MSQTTSPLLSTGAAPRHPDVLATALTDVLSAARCAFTERRRTGHRALGVPVRWGRRTVSREEDRLHELRATVAGLAASYALLRQPTLTESDRTHLEHLHGSELTRLQRLLDDADDAPVTAVDLGAVIDLLVHSLRVRGHTVRWSGTSGRVAGRHDDVVEILHVLLENAARHGAGCPIEVTVRTHGGFTRVSVRDHGPGVAAEVLPRLFCRGARGPLSTGSGIGLNIAYRRAQQLGGTLRLARPTGVGPGADFVLTLPVPPEPTCPSSPS